VQSNSVTTSPWIQSTDSSRALVRIEITEDALFDLKTKEKSICHKLHERSIKALSDKTSCPLKVDKHRERPWHTDARDSIALSSKNPECASLMVGDSQGLPATGFGQRMNPRGATAINKVAIQSRQTR
jgi:hypothetical protein